jgi:TPR repeat protein
VNPPNRALEFIMVIVAGPILGCSAGNVLTEPGGCDRSAPSMLAEECERGNHHACGTAGTLYLGYGCQQPNYPRAIRVLELGCIHNDAVACTRLGQAFADGHGVQARMDVAMVLFARGCELDSCEACAFLAQEFPKVADMRHMTANAVRHATGAIYERGCAKECPLNCRLAAERFIRAAYSSENRASAQKLLNRGCAFGDEEQCSLEPAALR